MVSNSASSETISLSSIRSSPPATPSGGAGGNVIWGSPVEVEYFYRDSPSSLTEYVRYPVEERRGKVADFPSTLDRAKVKNLATTYHFGPNVRLMVPRSEDRACSPPEGFITVYEECLKGGLRLPLHPAYAELLCQYEIALGQIMPNSFKQLSGLGVEVHQIGVELNGGVIIHFFQPKLTARSGGWYYLAPQTGFRVKTVSKVNNWQPRYFFCCAEDVKVPYFTWNWGKLRSLDPAFDYSSWDRSIASLGLVTKSYPEADLVRAGLSPCDPGQAVKVVGFGHSAKRKLSDIPVIGTEAPSKHRKVASAVDKDRAKAAAPGSTSAHPAETAAVGSRQSADRGKKKVTEVAKPSSPSPTTGTPFSPPRTTPRRFPEDVGAVAVEMVASATEFSKFLEEGAKAYARIGRMAERTKDERDALALRLAGAEAIAKAAEEQKAAALSEVEVARAEKESLASEMQRREAALLESQGDLVRAIAERIFGARHFSSMVNELAALVNSNVAAQVIDEIAKDYPDLDKTKYGYEVVDDQTIVQRYAVVLFEETEKVPVVEALASSSALLTPEAVRSCRKDRDRELDGLFERIRRGALEGQKTPPEVQEATALGDQQTTEETPTTNIEVIPELTTEVPIPSEETPGGVS